VEWTVAVARDGRQAEPKNQNPNGPSIELGQRRLAMPDSKKTTKRDRQDQTLSVRQRLARRARRRDRARRDELAYEALKRAAYEAVERDYPWESDAQKYRLMQVHILINSIRVIEIPERLPRKRRNDFPAGAQAASRGRSK
jgi:hypothetical protein